MGALEKRVDELDRLVDGHEEWSHRSRLHALANAVAGERAVRETGERVEAAVRSYKIERQSGWIRVREWGAFALAFVAIVISALRMMGFFG